MKIDIERNPKPEDLKTISNGIQSFNREHIQERAYEEDFRFVVFARNDQNEVVGGIRAVAFWNWLYIELLWLATESRGMGVGSALLDSTESFAMENDFFLSRVETTSFQALGFYKKHGYSVFGELDGWPNDSVMYFLKKELKIKPSR